MHLCSAEVRNQNEQLEKSPAVRDPYVSTGSMLTVWIEPSYGGCIRDSLMLVSTPLNVLVLIIG